MMEAQLEMNKQEPEMNEEDLIHNSEKDSANDDIIEI